MLSLCVIYPYRRDTVHRVPTFEHYTRGIELRFKRYDIADL